METQASVHPEFAKLIEKCIEYADTWRNPLMNDGAGARQFDVIYKHLIEVKHELLKD